MTLEELIIYCKLKGTLLEHKKIKNSIYVELDNGTHYAIITYQKIKDVLYMHSCYLEKYDMYEGLHSPKQSTLKSVIKVFS